MRRIRGWVGAEPKRPRAAARGYPGPQLRSSHQTHNVARGNVLFYWNHSPGGSLEIPVKPWESAHGTTSPTLARALTKEVVADLTDSSRGE